MSRVKITLHLTPEPEDVDEADDTGLTAEAYERLMSDLVGYDDVEVEKVDD